MPNNNPDHYFQQALSYHQNNDLVKGKAAYLRCLDLSPNHAPALINLGSICRRLGNTAQAIAYLRRAVTVAPQDINGHYNLANALSADGQLAEAVKAYRTTLDLDPDNVLAWHNLALVLQEQGEAGLAEAAYRSALAFDPEHREARLNLAGILSARGEISAACSQLEVLLEQVPRWSPALNNLATLLQDLGEHHRALELLREVMAQIPEHPKPRSNTLLCLQYLPGITAEGLQHAAGEWGKWALARVGGEVPRPLARPLRLSDAPESLTRPLRVGYVSADFCSHPVGLFFRNVLAAHDSVRLLPFAYSNGGVVDEVTQGIQASLLRRHGSLGGWREARDWDDETLANCVREDAIDVLIDLSGHTAKNRLAMFALRSAPVQLSWLGYFATTGLSCIDAVILDPHHAPPGAEMQFIERIVRLPNNRFCYTPVPFAPEVSTPPCIKNGFITFGSFNNTAKLNDGVLSTWADILNAVPNSRLILKWRTFADESYCDRIRAFFAARHIVADRLELRSASYHCRLLEEYADIDIGLDPFPFSGGHTSCEALWMGVPVITWPQERVVSRQTYSFLMNIGLPELAADSCQEYVQLAVELAKDPHRISQLRQILRSRMQASPLCDIADFTRHLEDAYYRVWASVTDEAEASYSDDAPAKLNLEEALKQTSQNSTQEMVNLPSTDNLRKSVSDFYQLGTLAYQDGQYRNALDHYRKAHLAAPHWFEPAWGVAVCCHQMRSYTEALNFYRHAMALRPDHPTVHYHYAKALKDSGQLDDALPAYEKALALAPENPEIGYSLGLLHLLLGDWLAGWKGYELRFQGSDRAASEHSPVSSLPLWMGEVVSENSGLVVYAEQGMGDSIQCFRYASLLRERFARLKFSVHAPLVGLFQHNAEDGIEIIPRVSIPIDETGYTHRVAMLSLPGLLGTTPDNVPAMPYLAADPKRRAYWAERLAFDRRLKIGLVWEGGKLTHAPARDMAFEYLVPLLARTDTHWLSLQKSPLSSLPDGITDWMEEVSDFADTAALIANFDLVIAVDTAVAHLAGAMGIPVWLLNRYESEWRWMRGRESTPWYPSMRIFNQPTPDDWGSVMRQIEDALDDLFSNYRKQPRTTMKTFLHVGCGPKRKGQTTFAFNTPDWQELRLDIDQNVEPDIVGTMLDMSAVADASVDAVFSSHNIEHLYPHEVPMALAEFKRVLKPDGFVVITCPDLQSVCALVAEDKLTEPAYTSPAGPIAPLDIIYGYRPPMAQGNLYMAHRCGFTQKVLTGTLQAAGFGSVAAKRRQHPFYDLWAVASLTPIEEGAMRQLALGHIPKG